MTSEIWEKCRYFRYDACSCIHMGNNKGYGQCSTEACPVIRTEASKTNVKYLEYMIEPLAEEVHNAWMEEKLAQGFHAPNECDVNRQIQDAGYPPKKDKFEKLCKKCHSDLYPYEELPENIKEYDRVTVRAVLSAIKKLGD